jgi:hypothetical protein
MEVVMKLKRLVLIIIISSMIISCASLAPKAIEDSDDGPVLVIEADKINKVVENWGLQNGFQYVAYRRIGTGTSTEGGIYGNQYGVYGSSRTVYYSKVLVMGINNIEDVPQNYNVVIVPSTPHQEMTEGGGYLLGTGIGLGIVGIMFLILF